MTRIETSGKTRIGMNIKTLIGTNYWTLIETNDGTCLFVLICDIVFVPISVFVICSD